MNILDHELLWSIIKTIVVLALLAPLVYFVTKMYGQRQITNSTVVVKDKISLGTNKAIYVIEWEDEKLLLAVTPNDISLLAKKPITSGLEEYQKEVSDHSCSIS